MHSNKMALFTGLGKRANEGDQDEHLQKKAKTTSNLPLSNIRYYKKQIYALVCENANISPEQILSELLKKEIDTHEKQQPSFAFSDKKDKNNSHLEFMNSIRNLLQNTEKRPNIISHVENYLTLPSTRSKTLKHEDNIFGLLIAFFDYYLDHYRLFFGMNLNLYPLFKDKIFRQLDIYRQQTIASKDIKFANEIAADILFKVAT